ncbi:Protein kinase-like domain [Phytophthora cactorum]|nr:Protein kinase-like domain [Phytophthora cactorum]
MDGGDLRQYLADASTPFGWSFRKFDIAIGIIEALVFGALLTELDTNQIPYSNARGSNGKILTDMTILHRVATGKLHPEVRSTCNASMKDLVERCLVEDPLNDLLLLSSRMNCG